MTDFAWENDEPGTCGKCRGSGEYGWGACVNGKMTHTGMCYSCKGTGKQSVAQIRNNAYYNDHKVIHLA